MSYESPIEIMQTQMQLNMENEICKAVQNIGINIDKDELIKALQYDREQYAKGYDDGLNAERWIPCSERLPEDDKYILLSFSNFSLLCIGRYEMDKEGGGAFYVGDESESCISQDLFVIAWQPLPEGYSGGDKEEECPSN